MLDRVARVTRAEARKLAVTALFEELFLDLAEIGIVVTQAQVVQEHHSVLYGLRLTPKEELDEASTAEL
jgi:hypothetical protein